MSVDFTYAPGPTARSIQFTDTSTPTPTFWAWDFGDGNTSSDQNPLHTYGGTGTETFNVTLETDPFAADVVSLLDFHESVSLPPYPSGFPTRVSAAVTEDQRGVPWTLWGSEHSDGNVTAGVGLDLPNYQSPNAFSNSVLLSDSEPSFSAAGDFTMELTHSANGTDYLGGAALMIVTNAAVQAPTNPGEFALLYNGGPYGFTIKKAAGGGTSATALTGIGVDYPVAVDNDLAVVRSSGILSVYNGGLLVAQQVTAADNTTIGGAFTFGGTGNGNQYDPNNYGYGLFKRWRYTVGAARYTAPYTVPDSFVTSVTEPVTVFGTPIVGPGAPRPVSSFGAVHVRLIDDVALIIRGASWSGWMDVRITRGIERLPSDFQVGLTEFAPGEEPIEILRGDSVVLKIGVDVVLTGYVDRIIRTLDARQHTVIITGRSKCEDLVDCAAEWPGGQIVGSSVLEIAKTLAAPYGINVTCVGDAGPPIPQFNLMRGETPFQIIERLCRFGQLLAYDVPSGDLLLTAVSKTPTASGFKEGVNVIRAQVTASLDQRFSEYFSYLQSMATLSDLGDGGDLQAQITDTAVPRHRRRIMISETSGAIGWEIAQKRAGWEAQRRRGRSTEVRITTDSWRDSAGVLYAPNSLAFVELPTLALRDAAGNIGGVSLTIGEVTYRRGDGGTTCELVLMPSESFTPQPFNVLQLLPFAELAQIAVQVKKP